MKIRLFPYGDMDMDRKKVAVVVIIVITLSTVSFLVIINPFATHFYYKKNLPSTLERPSVDCELRDLKDTNVTIGFKNDSSLWYSIDIRLYQPAPFSSTFRLDDDERGQIWLYALDRIKSVEIWFGLGVFHRIRFYRCENVNASVTYNSGASLGNSTYWEYDGIMDFEASGKLYFSLNEDVIFTHGGLVVFVGIPDYYLDPEVPWYYPEEVFLDIDLPSGLEGELLVYNATKIHIFENSSWYYQGNFTEVSGNTYRLYSTARFVNVTQQLVLLKVWATNVYARLKN